jgi:phospholipase/carboxylesterase
MQEKTMKPPNDLGFVHISVPAEKPFGRELWPGAALLGVRGKVLENGMPRFFRRFAEGVFDVLSMKIRIINQFLLTEQLHPAILVCCPLFL